MTDRAFTVDEANALLPELAESLRLIRSARQELLATGERIRRTAATNGGGRDGAAQWEAVATLRREVERLTARGIILRDPERGLIDFPARREGKDVFLCWRVGEDRVAFWHGPESGFSGRRPLDA